MDHNPNHDTDKSSIKPVSSLLSKFEGLNAPQNQSPTSSSPATTATSFKPVPPQPTTKPGLRKQPPTPPTARRSLDVSRPGAPFQPEQPGTKDAEDAPPSAIEARRPRPSATTERPRPLSFQATSSSQLPLSKQAHSGQKPSQVLPLCADNAPSTKPSPLRQTNNTFKPSNDQHKIPTDHASTSRPFEGEEPVKSTIKIGTSKQAPPPVNRAAKPGLLGIDLTTTNKGGELNVQTPTHQEPRSSPFTTPPDSESSSDEREKAPPVPVASKPPTGVVGEPPNSTTNTFTPSASFRPPRISSIAPPHKGLDHTRRRSKSDNTPSPTDDSDVRPKLPPRRQLQTSDISSTKRTSISPWGRQSLDLPPRPSALSQGFSPGSFPPRRESHHTILSKPRHNDIMSQRRTSLTPPPRAKPEPQLNRTFMRSSPALAEPSRTPETGSAASSVVASAGPYPNSSRANRRPPVHREGPRQIQTGFDTRLMDSCGDFVCTSGTSTRVWRVSTGKMAMIMNHPEGVKVTALAFKPSRDIETEGQYIWLGTNFGEIMEVNIMNKSVTGVDERTHSRREIVKMYRKATEIWTIDSEGKLIVWPADEDGTPNLSKSVLNGRASRGMTSSVIVGNKLWMAAGRGIRVFQPNPNPDHITFEVTQEAFVPPSGGDITSCAYLSSDPDRIYCGHSDGKISIFSKRSNKHVDTFSVSLYKVSCLAGVGDYLWAGFNSGTIMLFDPKTTPWTTVKYWQAHTHPVVSIIADRSSVWKLGRFHVLSLGIDSTIGVWDGMLEDDWIENDLVSRESEYCEYEKLTALLMTWNAGAVKPSDLRHDERNSNFFRDLLSDQSSAPDMIIFGLQELVDLEDKKLTAKSFFKGRSKDSYGQEHLSRVYRDWRDYLTKCVDDLVGGDEPFVQLHTASLVGLFTCVFIRSSFRSRIRDLVGAEVKTGMGGLHGNKGSLIVRFVLGDTAICLTNCHLAAGQTSTLHRNQDVQAILGSETLPPGGRSDVQSGTFVFGGDGSMVMDHEICIFNGDLNYRIDTMSRETVLQAIKSRNLTKLLDRDQLLLSRRKNPDFRLRDFYESPIEFLPTYKYDVGTDNYDSSDKRRSPAWCDRILCRGEEAIQPLAYRRHEVRLSDHRPVSASFRVRIKTRHQDTCEQIRLACKQRFEKAKKTFADESKSAYLKSVFGVSEQEARQLLKS